MELSFHFVYWVNNCGTKHNNVIMLSTPPLPSSEACHYMCFCVFLLPELTPDQPEEHEPPSRFTIHDLSSDIEYVDEDP